MNRSNFKLDISCRIVYNKRIMGEHAMIYDKEIWSARMYCRYWTGDDIRIFIWCYTDLVSGPMKAPCWIWKLNKNVFGYGDMLIREERLMHRNSYIAFKGPIPKGKVIMHLCNNKSCINPKHLEAGDDIENITAAYAAGLHLIYKGPPVHIYRRL